MSALKPLDEADGGGENYHGGGKNDDEFPSGQCQVCKDVVRTCSMTNAWVRTKLVASSMFCYLDILSDLLVSISIYGLIDMIERGQYFFWLSIVLIVLPTFVHSYYTAFVQGWRDRTTREKLMDLCSNLFFLRPAIELVNSCQVTVDLQRVKSYRRKAETTNITLMLNVTDDCKSEQFIVFKVCELACETLPQIFLQVYILCQIWDHWRWTSSNNEIVSTDTSFCSSQMVFFVSLGVSCFHVGITLQDITERDVPFGVFPRVLSYGMKQDSLCAAGSWMCLSFLYFAVDLSERLFCWVPFTVFFGPNAGFISFLMVTISIRAMLAFIWLGKCTLRGGLENFGTVDSGGTKRMGRKQRRIRKKKKIDWFNINALFAESLPWLLLGSFVDLPLSMKWLRGYRDQSTNAPSFQRYATVSGRYFISSNILSAVENTLLFCVTFYSSVDDSLTCGAYQNHDQSSAAYGDCKGSDATGNSTNLECFRKSDGLGKFSQSFYTSVNEPWLRQRWVALFVGVLLLRFLLFFIFYKIVYGKTGKALDERQTSHASKSFKRHRASVKLIGVQNEGRSSDHRAKVRKMLKRFSTSGETANEKTDDVLEASI